MALRFPNVGLFLSLLLVEHHPRASNLIITNDELTNKRYIYTNLLYNCD